MTPVELAYLQKFVMDRSGIVLPDQKKYLLEARLEPVIRKRGLNGHAQLIERLKMADADLSTAVIDAITTNETLFFRDNIPFELMREAILPALTEARRGARKLRIWCAACSTGQEPYSLSMMFEDLPPALKSIPYEIVATDLSETVLRQAREGVFNQFEVQRGLPVRLLLRHFRQDGTKWIINSELGRNITFQHHNLLQSYAQLGRFDVIFCRNALIYFSTQTKQDILNRLAESLAEDGYLILGGSETVMGLTKTLAPHRDWRGLYVRAGHPAAHDVKHMRLRDAG
jgi:chemotaxis protein methyltransferase CheR